MIILRQNNYSSRSTQALHKIVTTKEKVGDFTSNVSHKVRKALTKDAMERGRLDMLYKSKKKTDIDRLRDTIAAKNNIKETARDFVHGTKCIARGVISPGEAVSKAGEFVSDHPSSLAAALCVPLPGAAETQAALIDTPLQETFPGYKKAAEKTGKFYRKHLKDRFKRAVDGGIEVVKHVANS